jgi:hypothetical protein
VRRLAQIAYFIGSYKRIRWGLIPGYYVWVSILFYQVRRTGDRAKRRIETARKQMATKALAEWSEEFIQVLTCVIA